MREQERERERERERESERETENEISREPFPLILRALQMKEPPIGTMVQS